MKKDGLSDKEKRLLTSKSNQIMDPLRVIAKVSGWQDYSPEDIRSMRKPLKGIKKQGLKSSRINEGQTRTRSF
jgi:hypothetical protein